MNLLSDIRLKWYDDSSLMLEKKRELIELFLDTLGVSRDVAVDIFEVLVKARRDDIGLTTTEIRSEIIKLRKERKVKNIEDGLTKRNIQIWLKFFRDIGMIERFGFRYRFTKNKTPSVAFKEYTKPDIIDKSAEYMYKLLKEIENRYGIKK